MSDAKQLSLKTETAELPVAPLSEGAAMLAIIDRAARDPSVDVLKLEKLMDLSERVQARESERIFNEAMTAAQEGMGPVRADADNPQTRSKYASYAALDRAMRPIYTRHGFSLSFDTGDAAESVVKVLCYVSHRAGHSRTYHVDMPADGKGAKGGDVMTKTHAAGSAMSYGQRYLLKLIFNIVVGDDDDGNAAGNAGGTLDEDQIEKVRGLIESTGADVELFCKFMKVEAVPDIRKKDYEKAIASLNLKEKRARRS